MLQNSKFHEISKSPDNIPRTLIKFVIYLLFGHSIAYCVGSKASATERPREGQLSTF